MDKKSDQFLEKKLMDSLHVRNTSNDSSKAGKYKINEIFYSIQGEGVRAGTPAVFVRFSNCNLACRKETHGFDCDTEFESGQWLSLEAIEAKVLKVCVSGKWTDPGWIILTGGEPALQVDKRFCDYFRSRRWNLAIETNGSIELPVECGGHRINGDPTPHTKACYTFDWITVSPKVAEHAIRQTRAHEVKYVRNYGQEIPETVVKADHFCISPAFSGPIIENNAAEWCVSLVKQHPTWQLTPQMHKLWTKTPIR